MQQQFITPSGRERSTLCLEAHCWKASTENKALYVQKTQANNLGNHEYKPSEHITLKQKSHEKKTCLYHSIVNSLTQHAGKAEYLLFNNNK